MSSSNRNSGETTPLSSSRLQLSSNCPLCDAKFDPSRALVVDESKRGILFHLTCSKCCSSLLAVVAVSRLGLNSFGMLTDLTAGDVRRLRKSSAVDQDDVLQAYREFTNFSGMINKPINSIKK